MDVGFVAWVKALTSTGKVGEGLCFIERGR